MESFKKIVYTAKCPLQSSTKVAEIAGSASGHAPHSNRVYTVCEEEGVVGEGETGCLMSDNGQQCEKEAWILRARREKEITSPQFF